MKHSVVVMFFTFLLLVLCLKSNATGFAVAGQTFDLTGFSVKSPQTVTVSDKDVINFDVGNRNSVMVDKVNNDSVDLILYPFLSYSENVNLNKNKYVNLNLDTGDVIISLDNIDNGKATLSFELTNTNKNNTITGQSIYSPEENPSIFKSIIAAISVILFVLLLYIIFNKNKSGPDGI